MNSYVSYYFFFFNDTATTEIYTLSLHDALPICEDAAGRGDERGPGERRGGRLDPRVPQVFGALRAVHRLVLRSEEHTSELQSRQYLVCRLLLEKKKKIIHAESSLYNLKYSSVSD